jgi:hypothetical protein
MTRPAWISQVLLESSMIVFSILLALWVNDWQQDQQNEKLTAQSLVNFLKEIQRNEAWLEDVAPFHQGLATALKQQIGANTIRSRAELLDMVGPDGVRPPDLLDTAWQTAIATGALTHMDYTTVSALSLTYSQQARFREDVRARLPNALRTGDVRDEDAPAAARSVELYLEDVTGNEEQLRAVYAEAAVVIRETLKKTDPEALESIPPAAAEAGPPRASAPSQ